MVRRCLAILGFLSAFAPAVLSAADAHPRVLGFERFGIGKDLDAAAAGELLLGELNCTSCHRADDALATHIQKKPAPILDEVGSRVRPQYLLKFLADPQGAKAGTTMPNVLAAVPEDKRKETVEALVHFLASTGDAPADEYPRRIGVSRGEALFHSIGCAACHDPRPADGKPAPLPASIALGTPSRKYTLPSLAKFLENPLAVRSGARMPHLNLGPAEAREIASFLLSDLDQIAGLQFILVEGSFAKLPDFGKLPVKESGEADSFSIDVTKRKENFAMRFDGHIQLSKEGEYDFWTRSDDGSRLYIDDQVVVDNDGVHADSEKHGKKKLSAGLHTVAVEYFEASGGESLAVQVKTPGGQRQDLSALLSIPQKPEKSTSPASEPFVVNNDLAMKGKDMFASLGCASCHSMKLSGQPVAPTATAKPLAALKTEGGCLAEKPVEKSAYYALNVAQQQALATAIKAAKQPRPALAGEAAVHRSLVTFNCYACHQRKEIGGVDEPHNAYFKTEIPEMGEEGRLPPHLTLVGAKLTADWLKVVVDEGAKARPYMTTRMPKFGIGNVAALISALESVDGAAVKSAPKVGDLEDKKFKAAGKKLVGTQGFGCIKCHTFGDKKLPGIQAIDLTTMQRRLRPDWFHAYMLNPQEFRPGTRMPSAWPNGQTTLPTVLDGSTDKQIQAVRAYLADGAKAAPPVGLVQAAIELVAYDEAVMYRNFIDGAGPRAIGVGFPEKLNFAFDANRGRLALLWQNGFIDASKHWVGRGPGFQAPLGDSIIKLPDVVPFAVLADEKADWPKSDFKDPGYKFRGYRLAEKGRPVFMYSVGGAEVEDAVAPVGDADVYHLQRTLTLTAKENPPLQYFLAAQGAKIEPTKIGWRIDDAWNVKIDSATPPLVRTAAGKQELLVPITYVQGKAKIVQSIDW